MFARRWLVQDAETCRFLADTCGGSVFVEMIRRAYPFGTRDAAVVIAIEHCRDGFQLFDFFEACPVECEQAVN